ncbi:MAG: hypothetical protein M1831_002338 [Alyxoria varia]|nr:MAG: hypothetical protein M1831_002338 [Alyxoria varia]
MSGSDEKLSAAKVAPLASETKEGVPHDTSNRGAVGHDVDIEKAKDAPLGGRGEYQHTEPHADSSGVVGPDKNIQQTKVEPLSGETGSKEPDKNAQTGVRDENVDAARVAPLGEVREEMK